MVGYSTIGFILRKTVKEEFIVCLQGIFAVCFLVVGYFLYKYDIGLYGLNRFFSCYILVYIGQLLKGKMEKIYTLLSPLSLLVVSAFVLILIRPFGYINLAGNNIENPIYFLLASISGWIMMYSCAVILDKYSFAGNKAIAYLSVHSVPILALHFLAFKFVNYTAVVVNDMDKYMTAAFPVLMHGLWWIIYMVVGITLPLLVWYIYNNIKSVLIRFIEKV